MERFVICLIFSVFFVAILADDNYCRSASFSDPCMPGGKWDPVLNRCMGYDGRNCFQCYSGPQCKTLLGDSCVITGGGDPIVFQEYWESNGLPCTSIPSDFRPYYQFNQNKKEMLEPLENTIRELHASVGNVDAKGYHIVIGYGATQVTAAAMSVLSQNIALKKTDTPNSSSDIEIFAQAPYYRMYQLQANKTIYKDQDGKYRVAHWNKEADPNSATTIEVNTCPNNPDSYCRPPKVKDDKRVIHDFTYLWPHFTQKYALHATHEIMVFSGSKLTGHAGSRFGWALVKDEKIAEAMRMWILPNTLGTSIDMEMRVLGLLKVIVAQGPDVPKNGYFDINQQKMTARWTKLVSIFSSPGAQKKGYKLTNSPLYGPFSFLKCPDGFDCPKLLMTVNVQATGGITRGTSDNYVRIGLLDRTVENKILMERLSKLVSLPLPTSSAFLLNTSSYTLTESDILQDLP